VGRIEEPILNSIRTEIVLKDAADVAFWFSFSFRFVTFWQPNEGKDQSESAHRKRVGPNALVPLRLKPTRKAGPGNEAGNQK
jgi:hypothetical protein